MRIAVAMSGGVDSSLTAVLLKERGYDVVGLTLKTFLCADMDSEEPRYDVCCSPESISDAQSIAKLYGFPHFVVDVEEDFNKEIVEPFCMEYLSGRTPSPCIRCNSRIKFNNLIRIAKEYGCDKLSTGHYSRLEYSKEGRFFISAGIDRGKDQSYFLFTLTQEMLSYVIFPLGNYRKEEIRQMALDRRIPVAKKPESQEICFVLDDDYPRYIEQRIGSVPPPGDIVNKDGKKIGTHRGIHRYTIGQRRGLGISAKRPLYVVEIDAVHNVIVAGHREDLFRRGLYAGDLSYMKATSFDGITAFVKTRSTQRPVRSSIRDSNGGVHVYFDEPQIEITPGQAAVFYDEHGGILGGGWIERGL
jgi:tRNA-specific 2-thiouridylase